MSARTKALRLLPAAVALVAAGCHPRECEKDADCAGKVGALAACEAAVCRANACAKAPAPAGTPCSDGLACTDPDACDGAGACGGPERGCDDANPCTRDACAPAVGCVNEPRTGACDDGNACTADDACRAGTCAGTPVPGCAAAECGDGVCASSETCAACPRDCSPAGAGACGAACDPTLAPSCGANEACVPVKDGGLHEEAATLGDGACARGCEADGDCPGGRCLVVGGLAKPGVCAAACDSASDCGEGWSCLALAAGGSMCLPGEGCAPGGGGLPCRAAPALAAGGVRLAPCHVRDPAGCAARGLECVARAGASFHEGMCVGQPSPCDPADAAACPGGACRVLAGPALSGVAFVCGHAGSAAAGAACAEDAECAAGLACEGGACRRWCRPGAGGCGALACVERAVPGLAAGSLGLCAPGCGDGACAQGESCDACTEDCGACPPCGDGRCSPDETCESCPQDCAECPGCGDGRCQLAETCDGCPADCGACGACGDGACAGGETCGSCATDCGSCAGTCGDGRCSPHELCFQCPGDCGACPDACGDGTCGLVESCATCPADCACAAVCGNGTCDEGETCASCAADCGLAGLPACGAACDPTAPATGCADNHACVPMVADRLFLEPFIVGNGVCAGGCEADADCGAGRRCLALEGLARGGICGAACTPGGSGCPVGTCVPLGVGGVCVPGPACDAQGACPDATFASCARLAGAAGGVCLPGCLVQGGGCGDLECLGRTDAAWHAGRCIGAATACDPVAQTGCAAGETCLRAGGWAFGGGAAVCTSATGDVAAGGACDSSVRCAAGLVCDAGTCVAWCRPGAEACGAGFCEDASARLRLPAESIGVCR